MREIDLNRENAISYSNLEKLMVSNNRVAVIQPTGTGKSMIALKYLQSHPFNNALFLTSFVMNGNKVKEKIEDYGGMENTEVQTYSGLINDNIPDKPYDIIVLDEYHHCGAEITGKKLEALLSKNPNAKIIGTTATPIRWLDDQRDMTEELFNNVCARNMTLSYAVANKLLPSFTYVTGLYDYDSSELLDYYNRRQRRVDLDDIEEYRYYKRELMNSIASASGVNGIFKKHLKKDGKYVVFCDSKAQMEAILSKLKSGELDWLKDIDEEAEIYSVHSGQDDQTNISEFNKFDNSESNHLKLLFNINMVSEGIHPKDIDGVIMLRSTASMNVYQQQLGRALSVDLEKNPTIIDLANNISNNFIYEFRNSVYKEVEKKNDAGIKRTIDIRDIRVHDELRDFNDIIRKINRIPTYIWETNFNRILDKMEEFPNLTVDLNEKMYSKAKNNDDKKLFEEYRKILGEDLYKWLMKQLDLYNNKKLRYRDIKKLQFLGFVEERGQFSLEDKKQYDAFSELVDQYGKVEYGKLSEAPFESQLYLVRNYVDTNYFRYDGQTYDLEDFIQTCIVGLHNAINSYDPRKVSNYSAHVRNEIDKELRESLYSFDEVPAYLEEMDEQEIEDELFYYESGIGEEYVGKYIEEFLSKSLNKRQQEVIRERFGFNDGEAKTFYQLGKVFNISKQTAHQIETKSIRMLKRDGIYKRKELVETLQNMVSNINNPHVKNR